MHKYWLFPALSLGLLASGCTTINIYYPMVGDLSSAVPISTKQDADTKVDRPLFNIVHRPSGLCATLMSPSDGKIGLTAETCKTDAAEQQFTRDPQTMQISSPAVPGLCLANAPDHNDGTPRGSVYMERCAMADASQKWVFDRAPADLPQQSSTLHVSYANRLRSFGSGMVLDTTDPGRVGNDTTWQGLRLKSWGAGWMASPNLDFVARPIKTARPVSEWEQSR